MGEWASGRVGEWWWVARLSCTPTEHRNRTAQCACTWTMRDQPLESGGVKAAALWHGEPAAAAPGPGASRCRCPPTSQARSEPASQARTLTLVRQVPTAVHVLWRGVLGRGVHLECGNTDGGAVGHPGHRVAAELCPGLALEHIAARATSRHRGTKHAGAGPTIVRAGERENKHRHCRASPWRHTRAFTPAIFDTARRAASNRTDAAFFCFCFFCRARKSRGRSGPAPVTMATCM